MKEDIVIEKLDGSIVSPKGFYATGIHSGVKRKRNDLGVIYCEKPANAAAVYTLNQVYAAPIHVTKESMKVDQKLQAVIANSGNANACTGEQGMKDAFEMRQQTANKFGIAEHLVAVASTGVIGVKMPIETVSAHIKQFEVGNTEGDAQQFAEAILTTDTFTKTVCYETTIDGKTVTVAGVAKGSGMIEPNMGTMLGFITTDAVIESAELQHALNNVVNKTFNCITVDGDTSTNDTVVVMASELAGNNTLSPAHNEWDNFIEAFSKVCETLAKQIARDGEGATKLIEVNIAGSKSDEDAQKIAKAIVGSSLVKTAIYGNDANWGRILAAVGYSGAEINANTIDLSIGPIELVKQSEPCTFSESEAKAYLENENIHIDVHLNDGDGKAKAWGCDLTYDYVKINASYRS